jgi:hypothetical protein
MKIKLSAIVLSFVLVACAASRLPPSHDSYLANDFVLPEQGATILLLPVLAEYPEFVSGELKIQSEIESALREAGYQVVNFPRDRYHSQWRALSSSTGVSLDANDAQRIEVDLREKILVDLQQHIQNEFPHALLISAKVALRTADLKDASATWDRRKMAVRSKGGRGESGEWSGNTRGLSLELIVLNAQGKREMRSYTGLCLPYEADLRKNEMVIRNNLYARPDDYIKGIEIALAAFKPKE